VIIYDLPEADYHGDRARDSHSAIEIFLRRRSDYPKWRAGTYRRKPAKHLEFGGYFHALLGEGRAVADERYIVAPSRLDIGQAKAGDLDAHVLCNRTRKAGKLAYEECEARAAAEGKRIVLPQDAQRAAAMIEALRVHHEAGDLLFGDDGQSEVTVHFDGPTGRPSKCRIDRLRPVHAVDLKTYEPDSDSRRDDTERLVYQAYKFGYHRQAAWYLGALRKETGRVYSMPFVFVSNEDEPKVFVWWAELDATPVSVGEDENFAALEAIAECERTGDWRQPFERNVGQPLPLPPRIAAEFERRIAGGLDTSGVGDA
jgi:hypothetical protein